jgi:hypothetical protein
VKSIKKSALIRIHCLTACLCFSLNAHALVILQNASVSTNVDYDTNVNMSKEETSIWRYRLLPTYTISAVDDLNRWYSRANLNIQRSSDRRLSLDREDPSIGVGWERELARGRFSLTGNYDKASTRVTEFLESGLVTSDASSIRKSIAANWSRLLTERLNWTLGGGYTKVTFTGGGGFSGYNSKSLNTSLSYEWSDKLRPFINFGYSTFNPESTDQESSNSKTYSVGASYELNPRLTTTGSVGITRLSSGVGKVGSVALTYSGDLYQISGNYSRNVTPSSIGGFQNADALSLNYGYTLSEKSSIGTSFSWRRNNSLNDVESRQISAFYSRNLAEYWQMRLSLQMREIKSTNQNVNGDIIGISLIYNTPEF